MTRLAQPLFGLDSTSEVPVASHHAVHSSFAARYLSRYEAKVVTAREYQDYKRAGIGLAAVFEDGAANALAGYEQGKSDAQFAQKQATAAGMPSRRPIYFAVDFDPAGSPERVDDYFNGVAAVLSRALSGPYGGFEVVSHLMDRGFAYGWQTYAWSAGRLDVRAQLYQYSNDHTVGGVGVDYDKALSSDYGQWGYALAPADPQHYQRFDSGAFPWKGRLLHERSTVIAYDRLRKHPHVHTLALHQLRSELQDLADHVYFEAHRAKPPTWGAYHRGWRYQQLAHRAQGRRLA